MDKNSYKITSIQNPQTFFSVFFLTLRIIFLLKGTHNVASPYPLQIEFLLILQTNICQQNFMQNQIRDLPLADLKPTVQVYAIISQHHQYEDVGTGTLQIVTDSDLPQPQHYIEVTSLENTQLILRSRLQARNNFQRQKSAIICWQDIEQFVSQELALSFQKIDECDMYWKIICEKIGKNYLQINGNEPLQNPTQENLAYILDKSKNSYNLIAFHIINSPKFMEDFKKVFFVFKEKNDSWGISTMMRIVQQIFSHTDYKVVNNFLLSENFTFLLQLYKEFTHINFPEAYSQKIKLRELIPLSTETNKNIEIFHHYMFFRDCMIDLSKNMSLEQMLNVWIRQTQISILNNLAQDKILHRLVQLYTESQKQHSQDSQKVREVEESITTFLFQILWMLKLAQSQSLRKKYIDSFFESGILKPLEQILQKNKFKILQIFDYICARDPKQFLNFFRDQFRQNPSLNLNRIISKEFASNTSISMATAIINFLTTFISEIIDKKQFMEFFNGTFLFSVFSTCNIPFRNLSIIKLIFEKSSKITGLINVLLRTKFFFKLPLNNRINKNELLQLFKVIKIIIFLNGKNNLEKSLDEIQDQNKLLAEIIESGVFTFCLEYLKKNIDKNCLLVSSMLENISILSEVNFNSLTKFVQQFDFELEEDSSSLLKVYLSKIQMKEVPKIENQLTRENMQGDNQRKQHYRNLQIEQEERYLLDDDQFGDQGDNNKGNSQDQQLKELLKMKKEIQKERKQEDQKKEVTKQKIQEKQPQNFTITFNMDFGEPQ